MTEHFKQALYVTTLELDDALIPPYGGSLVQAFVHEHEQHDLRERLPQLKRVDITARELVDLEMIASGAYSPLTGFMDRDTYSSVLDSAALTNGLPWGLPVTLAATEEVAKSLGEGQGVALYHDDDAVGVMLIADIFPWDEESEVRIFAESDGRLSPQIVERKARKVRYLLGGVVSMLISRSAERGLKQHHWPKDLRSLQVQKRWSKIAAIHLQNPWQRSDEYLLKCALEASDAVLLHSSTEPVSEQNGLLSSVLKGASRLLLDNYIPSNRVVENPAPDGIFQSSFRAVLQHAILSQNYGCESIFLPAQGRVTSAQQDLINLMFAEDGKRGLAIRCVSLDYPFHCDQCGGVATERSCPHDAAGRIVFSDSEIATQLQHGKSLPHTVARPDVARAVARGMARKAEPGDVTGKYLYPHVSEVSRDLIESLAGHKAGVLWMTGLSGSGKSTIAHRVERELMLSGHRVYVLDGDTLRTGLNSDLGFGEEARRENLRRAAEVAKVLVDAGLIVIASFISPFSAEREMVRKIVGEGFYEVYVEASLETCEERDPKGLYQRARAGVIPKFTGISSPYEAPEHPDLRLNTSQLSLDACVRQFHDFIAQAELLRADGHGRPHAVQQERFGT
jgi:adenylyl-sulfate kinase